MKFEGIIEAPVGRSRFYQFITDPAEVVGILPDVKESHVVDGDHFTVKAKVGVALLRGDMTMDFQVTEKKQDASVSLVGHGKGMQSSVDLVMAIVLEDKEGGTLARWTADTAIGGLLASVGGRLISNVAERYMKQITERLREKVASG